MKLMNLCLVISLLLSVGCKSEKSEIGSKDNPLKMYFVPTEDTDGMLLSAEQIAVYLMKHISQDLYGKNEGFYIKAAVPNSYIAVVEAFGTARADFAAINTYSFYILKRKKKYDAEAIVRILRGKAEKTYKAQIIARTDSKINSLNDLNGKKFAYTDPASTAGYIVPSIFLKEKGIKLGETVFAQRHDNVVSMVYQGQVDAGATYHSVDNPDGTPNDARTRVITQFPDVLEKVKIVSFTGEIPNAPWILRTSIYKDKKKYETLKKSLSEGMLAYAQDKEGSVALAKLYGISGLVLSNDNEFDDIFSLFTKAEKEKK